MRFLLLYRTDRKNVEAGVPPSADEVAGMDKLMEDMGKAGVLLSTEGLQPSSRGARVRLSRGRITMTNGPFTDAKEIIAGYAVLQVKAMEEAVQWTKRFLDVAGDGESEIRELYDASAFGPGT